jgi:hypothetical protein
MRRIIWNWIKIIFQSELNGHALHVHKELMEKNEEDRVYINYPIGQKVIVRSNEPDELVIGDVVDYEVMKNRVFLVVKNDKTGEKTISLNNKPPYWSPDRESALRKLNWCEQWNVMTQYTDMTEEDMLHKESPEYRNRKNMSNT